ncbi:MAG TPA: thermonuclease family protein [Alphaproteobacteria bacterium]|nr:thermonuclease family protein [Alphaproteobacteria bacterium]
MFGMYAFMRLYLGVIVLLATPPAEARQVLNGPVVAEVLEVIDGDTLAVRAHVWLGQTVETRVRLTGIDTPELRGGCDAEKALAERARRTLAALIGGRPVRLRDIEYDKYGGRVLARVETADGIDPQKPLVAAGLATPYEGRGPRIDRCSIAARPG